MDLDENEKQGLPISFILLSASLRIIYIRCTLLHENAGVPFASQHPHACNASEMCPRLPFLRYWTPFLHLSFISAMFRPTSFRLVCLGAPCSVNLPHKTMRLPILSVLNIAFYCASHRSLPLPSPFHILHLTLYSCNPYLASHHNIIQRLDPDWEPLKKKFGETPLWAYFFFSHRRAACSAALSCGLRLLFCSLASAGKSDYIGPLTH